MTESSFLLLMSVSQAYRVRNWPRFAGAFEPWIALWQFVQARAMNRVLTLALN